ncbi:NUDIX hydrolase [bacterium]|nr:NUDIX hydrolase [bacterium]
MSTYRLLTILTMIPMLLMAKSHPRIDDHFKEYLSFLKSENHGELGNYKEGQIEVIIDPKTVQKIEENQAKRYIKAGESPKEAHEHARTGIVARDRYWVWVRDAVIYPSGAIGTYNRLVKAGEAEDSGNNTVAIFPMTKDKKIILNITYRHAIRDWVLELPRGRINQKEDVVEAAKRELKEETGMIASSVQYLGEVIPYSGTIAYLVPIYYAKIESNGFVSQDYTEAIMGSVTASLAEIKEGIAKGYMVVDVKNKKKKIRLKDSFLLSALVFAEQKKLL